MVGFAKCNPFSFERQGGCCTVSFDDDKGLWLARDDDGETGADFVFGGGDSVSRDDCHSLWVGWSNPLCDVVERFTESWA